MGWRCRSLRTPCFPSVHHPPVSDSCHATADHRLCPCLLIKGPAACPTPPAHLRGRSAALKAVAPCAILRTVPPSRLAMRGRARPCLLVVAAAATVAVVVGAAAAAVVAPSNPSFLSTAPEARAVSAAAAATAGPVTIPFPSPLPGVSRGRLHTLPALQCRMHPATPGGASPDPDAVTDPYGRGGTGWVLRRNATAADVVIPYGAGTCATPLEDAAELEFLAAPDEMNKQWFSNLSSNVTTGGETGAEFGWAGHGIQARLNFAALVTDKGPSGVASAEYFRPHPCASAGGHPGLVCSDEVSRLLSAHRNQRFGLVQRHRGLYDVLSVSRESNGVVLDKSGLVVAAQDRVSDTSGDGGFVVVMYTTRDNHTRPVLVGEAALLSLGRAVMADPSWLGASFPGGVSASVRQSVLRYNHGLRYEAWSLHHDNKATNASSLWLPNILSILCQSPSASFVEDSSLCDGVEQPQPSERTSLHAGGRPVADLLGVGSAQHPEYADVATLWHIETPQQAMSAPACPSFHTVTYSSTQTQQPIWLLGRGSRELHATGPAGETEMALARRISSCAYNDTRWDLYSFQPTTYHISSMTVELSQRYRRDLFRADPPEDPIPNGGLILSVLVVVPEAVAVMLLLLQRHGPLHRQFRWHWRNVVTLGLILIAGAIALVGVGYLDRQEQAGHAWRAATVRTGTRIHVNSTEQKYVHRNEIDYRGRLTWHTESLIIVARTGYRPHVTRRLLVGSIIAYVSLAAAVLVQAVVAAWLWRRPREGDTESGPVGSTSAQPFDGLPKRTRAAAPPALAEGDPLADDDDRGGGGDIGGGGSVARGCRVPTQDGRDW